MSTRKRRSPLKKRFANHMQKKLVILFMLILLAFTVLAGRILYIDAASGEAYTKIVLDQQQYASQVIPFKRGDILDTNGTKLATSERVYNVILDAHLLLSDEKKAEKYKKVTKAVLNTYFEIAPETVDQILEENPDGRYNILKKGVTYDEAKAYEEGTEGEENLRGVWLEEDYVRTYPYGALACDVLGFSVDGNVGASGLEVSYNSVLNGTDGRRYGYQEAAENMQTVKEPVNGNSIVTTIDTNLQSIVEKHLSAFNEAHRNGDTEGEGFKNGAVIIMDPNTGAILAESSYPNFDLNNPRDLSRYYTQEQLEAMTSEEKLNALNGLWRNFCVSDTYEPGSTMKPFTVAAALENGTLKGDETYYCGGYLHVGDYDIQCISFSYGGHGQQNLTQVMENSCNVALMEIGMSLGGPEMSKYQHIFGYGEYTGIDLPGEANGILFNGEDMISTDIATNAFGQNFTVTMTQMTAAFCSLVNGGNYYQPHVVKAIQDSNGSVIETVEPVLEKRTVSKSTSDLVKSYMYSVVEHGSGLYAQVEGYDVGGKTGTAEKYPRGENKNVVSFIGYAPQENPEVVIYVVIDEPNVPNQAACSNQITTLALDIMKEAFPYLNITKAPAE